MAATIAATPTSRVIRWSETDVFGERITKTIEVSGASDAQIQTFLDDYEALTNVAVTQCSVQDKFEVTGLVGTATNALSPFLSSYMGYAFRHDNTTNPSRPGRRMMKYRAPIETSYGLDGNPVSGIIPDVAEVGTTVLNRVNRSLGFLQDFQVFRETETDPVIVGGWEYYGAQLATENRIADGDSLT